LPQLGLPDLLFKGACYSHSKLWHKNIEMSRICSWLGPHKLNFWMKPHLLVIIKQAWLTSWISLWSKVVWKVHCLSY